MNLIHGISHEWRKMCHMWKVYASNPTSSLFKIETRRELESPAFTVCPRPGVSDSRLASMGLHIGDIASNSAKFIQRDTGMTLYDILRETRVRIQDIWYFPVVRGSSNGSYASCSDVHAVSYDRRGREILHTPCMSCPSLLFRIATVSYHLGTQIEYL